MSSLVRYLLRPHPASMARIRRDPQVAHQWVWGVCRAAVQAGARLLFRIEPPLHVVVQAPAGLSLDLPRERVERNVPPPAPTTGAQCRVSALISPRRNEFRPGRRGRKIDIDELAVAEVWWRERMAASGLDVRATRLQRRDDVAGEGRTGRLRLVAWRAEAEGAVTDAVALAEAVEMGIGSGRAYGFGLLDVEVA